MINLFTRNKTRKARTAILEDMLKTVIKENSDKNRQFQRGLCSIAEDHTVDDKFLDYLKTQRPTIMKNSEFFDKEYNSNAWWWATSKMDNTSREMFVRHLLKKNKPFKLF